MFLKDKKITVVGLGKSGLSSALFLKRKGAIVRASDDGDPKRLEDSASLLDKHGIKYEIGQHTINYLKDSDLIVVSPGVKLSSKPLIWAKEMGIEVISEIELASRFCKSPIIAVTGTNGKSTVITLIGKILKEANKRAVVCGNIGRPFIKVLPSIGKNDFVVLEVSSFQLSFIKKFKPYIAILLNISRNHLDWHKSLSHYISSKANIFKNQTSQDYAILNFENKEFKKINANIFYFSKGMPIRGAYIKDHTIFSSLNGDKREICKSSRLTLKGEHNLENILAAITAALICGTPLKSIKRSILSFKGLEHRIEYIAAIGGIKFVNDSKSTTVDATIKAISACDGRVVLIAGGRDKGSDFSLVKDIVKSKVRYVVLIGEAKGKIAKAIRSSTTSSFANSLIEAVLIAINKAEEGDTVLLSPMCASFDMFENFKDRGKKFKECVYMLKSSYKKV